MITLLASLNLFWSGWAIADEPCRTVSDETAVAAVRMLAVGQRFTEYSPVSSGPMTSEAIMTRTMNPSDLGGSTVMINGHEVDLGRVYVPTETPGVFRNIGLDLGCDVRSVPDTIGPVANPDSSNVPTPSPPQPSGAGAQLATAILQGIERRQEAVVQPFDVLVMVLNPRDVAVAEKGSWAVGAGDLFAAMGVMDSVEDQVYDQIVATADQQFRAEGVAATVAWGRYTIPDKTGYIWSGPVKSPYGVRGGSYPLVKITIHNPMAVAQMQRGAVADLGVIVGMNVPLKVREGIEEKVSASLAASGAKSVMLR